MEIASRPVLAYRSATKGEQLISVADVRREKHLDSDLRVCFSVGLTSGAECSGRPDALQARYSQERVLLMAASDLEAVALLTCLRRILEPGRALPTLWDATHFPGQALQMLE